MIIKKINHIKNMEDFFKEHKNEKIIVVNFQENKFNTIKEVVEKAHKQNMGVEIGSDFFYIFEKLNTSCCISNRILEEVVAVEAENPL